MITDHRYFGSASLLESGMTIDSEGIPARTSRSSPPDSITPYNWVNQAVSLGVSLGGASGDALGNRTEWGMVGTPAAIFGLQIYDGQNYRNAWLRVEAIPLPSGGNHYRVADWAYSPEPGAAVFAGITQVPEPTTATLLLSGLACILAAVAFTFLPGRVDQERPLDPPAAQK